MNIQRAFDRLADRIVELSQLGIIRLPEIVAALLVALFAFVVAGRLSGLTQRIARRAGGPPGLVQLAGRLTSIAILVMGSVVVLYALGLGQLVLSFVASLGIVGFILGFALQDIARQFASGALLLTLRPFDVGDEISVKDFQGVVVNVQLLTTVLRSTDGLEVLIPNADVYTSPIVNHSRYGLQRGQITLHVPALQEQALDQLRARLLERARSVPHVIATPAPDALWRVPAEGSIGSLQMEVRFWVDCRVAELEQVQSVVMAALLEVLRPAVDAAE